MKIFGLKYKVLLGVISIILLSVDLFLIVFYGFKGQLLIFLYIIIGIVALCSIFAICSNMFIPTITFNYDTKTIITDFVANELYQNDKHLRNQCDLLHFNEIINCEINNKQLIITLKYGQVKTWYLSFFAKTQIHIIYKEINEIINNK